MLSISAHSVCRILLLACILLTRPADADDPPAATNVASVASERQIYVVEVEKSSRGRLFFSPILPKEGQQANATLAVRGSVLSRTANGDRRVAFVVENSSRKAVYSLDLTVAVQPGSIPFAFDWPMGQAGDGDYTARLEIFDTTFGEEARVEWRVYLRTASTVAARVEAAREEVTKTRQAAGEAIAPPLRQRLVLALEALAPFPSAGRPLIEADSNARFAADTAKHVRAMVAFGWGSARPGDATSSVEDKFIPDSNSGRILGGIALGGPPASVDRLAELGFRFAPVVESGVGVAAVTPVEGNAPTASANLPVMVWLPRGGDIALPHTADELKAAVSGGHVAVASLWTQPKAAPAGPESKAEFQQYLAAAYSNRVELGRAWKQNLAGFNQVEISPAATNRAYQYDLQTFQRERMTAWVSDQLKGAAESIAPAVPSVMFTDSMLRPGDARTEPDVELLSATLPVLTVGTSGPLTDERYAQRFPAPQLMYALFHSFAPGRPLVAVSSLDFGLNDRLRTDSVAQLRTLTLEAALEGVSALAIEFKNVPDPVSCAPEAVSGFAAALRDVGRAEEAMAALRSGVAPVLIVWSDSSRLLDKGTAHLNALINAYEGCSFGGHKVGFITERQLAEGRWRGVNVVVLPDVAALGKQARTGLESLIASGVGVIRTESGPIYDEHGRAAGRGLSVGANSALVRGRGQPRAYLDALDEFISRGLLPPVPRAITGSGYPIEGVKTRYVENGDARYLYVVNLRKEAVLCRLSSDIGDATDVLTGRPVSFPRTIDPLDPMLLRLAAAVPVK